jgi:GTP-binding protein
VRRQAEIAIGLAHVVIFLVDAQTGATDLDSAIAHGLRRAKARTLLVVNKVDRAGDPVEHDFHRLGLGEPVPISSENGFGIGDLLDLVVDSLPPEPEPETEPLARIAIVGRPNVGKSSIVNALLHEERMIVEPKPGTTLDPIDARWETPAGSFVLVDTAGIRRQSHFGDQAEFYANVRALSAVERADIACLVVDVSGGFQGQDARLAQHALDAGCSTLILYNKWDLVPEREVRWKELIADRARRYPTLAVVPAAPVSATIGTHLHRLPHLLQARVAEHQRRVKTPELNDWLKAVQRRRAVPSNNVGKLPKIYYMTQTGTRPPTFTLFVNAPSRLSENYRRYLWSQFTEHFGFTGTPVRLLVKKSD